MQNDNKNFLVLIAVVTLLHISCMRTVKLRDGITKVPVRTSVYKNKIKFDKTIAAVIDTSAFFEEIDPNFKVLKRLDSNVENSFYGVYRFYSNGYLNYFVVNRDTPIESDFFDPQLHGYRGVYYLKKNKICYDLFCTINQAGWIGLLTGHFTIKGDTLIVTSYQSKGIEVYVKRKAPESVNVYRGNW